MNFEVSEGGSFYFFQGRICSCLLFHCGFCTADGIQVFRSGKSKAFLKHHRELYQADFGSLTFILKKTTTYNPNNNDGYQ